MIFLESAVGNYITSEGKQYSYFAGNNYLGLANHPKLIRAATETLVKYGVNFSASRQTTGTSVIHIELEKLLSDFKDRQDSVVFASGYMGNRLLLNALKDEYAAIFTDSMAHPSILDGIPKDIALVSPYGHCNPDHLESLLKKSKKYRPLIITDGVFALTGEIAPIDQIYALAEKYNALLIVDDAHGTGVLGENGRGTPEHFNLGGAANLYQSETMSKALGGYGGFISAEKRIINKIRSQSKFYGASTALPPPIVAAGCSSVRLVRDHPELRAKLMENARLIRSGVREMEFETTNEITPIIPVFFKNQENAKKLSVYLEKNNIIAPAINYPMEMERFIVRITVSANHTREQIENLLVTLKEWRDKHASIKD
jgi:7-keto-8-aminopelargonate synthetase-like enzyme